MSVNQQNHKAKDKDKNSSQGSFEDQNPVIKQHAKQQSQTSEFFSQYSQTLKGISVKDYLKKYKSELKNSKISFNERCYQPEMSLVIIKHTNNYEIVTLFVSFSHFSFQISIASIQGESFSQTNFQMLGQGVFGKVYKANLDNKNVVIKSIQYSNDFGSKTTKKEASNTISKVIFQYCLYKLFSVFEIGPRIINIFGFDLLIFDNTIQFSIQRCQKGHHKLLDSLYLSLDIMHSFGIIHGDIKSDNIMWSPSFHKWVFIDFGFSQVLRQKPGQKTLTKYFGTFQNSSKEMKNLFNSLNSEFIDLYYNDLFGMNTILDETVSYLKEAHPNKQKCRFHTFHAERVYSNFLENSRLCYIFFIRDYEKFCEFCQEINKDFSLLDVFWNIMKNTDIYFKGISIFKALSWIISSNENMLVSEFFYKFGNEKQKVEQKQIKKQSFHWRFQQKVNEFCGAIDDIMLFSLIFQSKDISPLRFMQKQLLIKDFFNNFKPSNEESWKNFLKLLNNPYVNLDEITLIFDLISKELEIQDRIDPQTNWYQLFASGRHIANVCVEKFGFNLFELNQRQFLNDSSDYQQKIISRIFCYSKFSDLIQLHSNQFPYLQFLNSLRNDLKGKQFVLHSQIKMQLIQQKYKIKNEMVINHFQTMLRLQLRICSEDQIVSIYASFIKLPTFALFTYMQPSVVTTTIGKVLSKQKNPPIFLTSCYQQYWSSIFSIISVEYYFIEKCNYFNINFENNLEELIKNYFTNFQKLIPKRENLYFYFLDNSFSLYLQFRLIWRINQINKTQANLKHLIYQVFDQKLTLFSLFRFICKMLKGFQITKNNTLKLENNEKLMKHLFEYFESQNPTQIQKLNILALKIQIYYNQSVLSSTQYSSLLKTTTQLIFQIQQQHQNLKLCAQTQVLDILKKYFLTIDSLESKRQKQKHLKMLIQYAYHQNGDLTTFPIIMQIIILFSYFGEQYQFQEFIQIVIKGTYFRNDRNKQMSKQYQKFVTADHAIQQFIHIYQQNKYERFKNEVFSFFSKGKTFLREQFYLTNGNAILLIEKVLKFYILGRIKLDSLEFIQILKTAYLLIGKSNFSFSRSFNSAMNYWMRELIIKSGVKLLDRKKKIIVSRYVRNHMFQIDEQFFVKYCNDFKYSSSFPPQLQNQLFQNFKYKTDQIIKNRQYFPLSFYQRTKFGSYMYLLSKRPSPDFSVSMVSEQQRQQNDAQLYCGLKLRRR